MHKACLLYTSSKVVAVQFPVTTGPNFNQIVDVLKMKLYQWGPEGGKPEVLEIPDELMDKAKEYQQALIEAAAENDETLMEKFFELGTLTEDEMREGIRQGLINRDMYPVFCVSAGKMCIRDRLAKALRKLRTFEASAGRFSTLALAISAPKKRPSSE